MAHPSEDPMLEGKAGSLPVVARATGITLSGVFRRAVRVYGNRTAVVSPDQSLTYAELGARASQVGNALSALGIGHGDRIAVLAENRPEYVETYIAAASLGVTVVALNTRLHPGELAYCVQQAKPKLLVTSAALIAVADQFRNAVPSVGTWICYDGNDRDGYLGYREVAAAAPSSDPDADPGAEDIHNVLFTSGTTGRPKGAMISQRAAATRGLRLAQWLRLTEDDGFVGWVPLFHCGGDEPLYATFTTGGTYATLPKADVETMFTLIERHRLTWTLLLPGVITDFLHHPRREDFDLSSFRMAGGYANMMPRVIEELTKTMHIDYFDAFGQTESSLLVAHGWCHPGIEPSLRKTPTPLMDIRLVDDDQQEVDVGVPGECVVRGPTVMSGYLDNPEATGEAFRGGWLHTGDVLVRHEDGTLTYTDRKKYLIKTGGENVYPAEVETVIAAHPAVQEVCVLGVPDEHWGETIKAVIVTSPGHTVTSAELVQWCRQQLAGYKRPRYIEFRTSDDMPRSTTGKLLRHELAALPATEDQRVQ